MAGQFAQLGSHRIQRLLFWLKGEFRSSGGPANRAGDVDILIDYMK
jgi:hypothetical protein